MILPSTMFSIFDQMASPYSDNLQRQVTEIEALRSVFPEERCLLFSQVEEDNLAAATVVLAGGDTDAPRQLSGTVRLPGLSICGQPVSLRFVLPALYPCVPPSLQVECSASRETHDALTHELHECVEEQAGAEVLLLAVDCLQQAVQKVIEEQRSSSTTASGDAEGHLRSHPDNTQDSGANASCIARRLIWFHHILSTTKRKSIVAWGSELELGGYCVPGHPGVLICEGEEDNVAEYVRRIRGLRWQAMAVRSEEKEPCEAGQVVDSFRRFRCSHITELPPEGGLSRLGQLCEEAGLQHMFLTALKIS